jgi:hypothetical protein
MAVDERHGCWFSNLFIRFDSVLGLSALHPASAANPHDPIILELLGWLQGVEGVVVETVLDS